MEPKKIVLKNGLRVVFVPMKDTQTATIQILVEAGSKYENKRNNGLSHFLEHMMFKGTKKRPSTIKITKVLDEVGGDYNAFTGKEQTGYWVKVPSKHFKRGLDVVSDMYLNPLLKQEEIDRERGVILQEAAMYRDTPMRYVWDVFEDLLYGDQPAGWSIIGSERNIKNLQRKDFVNYLQNKYLPQSTVIAIAGNFPQDEALALIEENFNLGASKKKAAMKKTVQKQNSPQLKIYQKDTDQTHLLIGVRSPHMFSSDRYVAVVLGTIFGGGMSARAFINIRERHGLTYYINSATEMTTDAGYLFFAAGVEHGNLLKTQKLILEEFKKVNDKLVGEAELKKAKEYLKGKTLMSLESTSNVATFFGDQELFYKKLKKPEDIFKKVDAVSREQVNKIAKKIVKDSVLNMAVVGPHNNFDEIKSQLHF